MIQDEFPKPATASTLDPSHVRITEVSQDLAQLRAAYDETPPTEEERTALLRLVKHAQGNTGQSRRVADFLLAWWDAGRCGGFDMTNLWGIDRAIARDIVTVFGLIARLAKYPDHIDQALEAEFQAISKTWGPDA